MGRKWFIVLLAVFLATPLAWPRPAFACPS